MLFKGLLKSRRNPYNLSYVLRKNEESLMKLSLKNLERLKSHSL
jgi:hypothetical protein